MKVAKRLGTIGGTLLSRLVKKDKKKVSQRKLPKIIDVTNEQAYEIAEELQNQSVHENAVTKVFSGTHPIYGPIYVVIPPLGVATLLPIVSQLFSF